MPHFFDSPNRRASLWLAAFALAGTLLVWLYPDAEQQDAAYHFLFARWAGQHPHYFISVWARPLFTLIYFIPSQFGYPTAKLFTVIISLTTAWQTFRLARQLGLQRAELVVPLLFLQPAFFVLSSWVMTETLFALLFVVALRLHISGRIKAGMLLASLLILIRPEGFFIGVLWGAWVLRTQLRQRDRETGRRGDGFRKEQNAEMTEQVGERIRNLQSAIRNFLSTILNPQCLLLASGMLIWWLAAYLLTGDTLWIAHDWPHDWQVDGQANGTGPIWWYVVQLPVITGLPLFVPFLVGLWQLLKRRKLWFATSSFLTLFILHSLMFIGGWFGSAGYARYFVCVSPVVALITLAGWNDLAERRSRFMDMSKPVVARAVLVIAGLSCMVYVDAIRFTRDALAVEVMHDWIRLYRPELFEPGSNSHYRRLVSSQAYPVILLDRDPWEKASFTSDRQKNLELMSQLPEGTLVLWEDETGPKWYKLRDDDFESAGYERLKSQDFRLEGYFMRLRGDRLGGWRSQRMHWFYKSETSKVQPESLRAHSN